MFRPAFGCCNLQLGFRKKQKTETSRNRPKFGKRKSRFHYLWLQAPESWSKYTTLMQILLLQGMQLGPYKFLTSSMIQTWDLSLCLFLNLKYDDLYRSATTAGLLIQFWWNNFFPSTVLLVSVSFFGLLLISHWLILLESQSFNCPSFLLVSFIGGGESAHFLKRPRISIQFQIFIIPKHKLHI